VLRFVIEFIYRVVRNSLRILRYYTVSREFPIASPEISESPGTFIIPYSAL